MTNFGHLQASLFSNILKTICCNFYGPLIFGTLIPMALERFALLEVCVCSTMY